jgi:UDP-N-acetyl-D-galactosamine dehydrogenase
MVLELKEYGIVPIIVDPVADQEEAHEEYGLTFAAKEDLKDLDALIIAVSHDEFKAWLKDIPSFFKSSSATPIIFDLKALYERQEFSVNPLTYWRL